MRRITILETVNIDSQIATYRVAFWFPIPVADRVLRPDFISAIRGPAAPSQEERTALQSGAVEESVRNVSINRRHPETGARLSAAELEVEFASVVRQIYMARLLELQDKPAIEPQWPLYGTTFTDEEQWVIRRDNPPPIE